MTVTIIKNRQSLAAGQYHDDLGKSHYETGTYPHKNHDQILVRPGQSVQNRELNFLQTILQEKIKAGNDISFKNGTVVAGLHATVVVTDVDNITADVSEGLVYWDGNFRTVEEFTVSFARSDMTRFGSTTAYYLRIGLKPIYSVIDVYSDAKLGDPAILYQTNQMIRGSDRLYIDFTPTVCELEYDTSEDSIKKTAVFAAANRQLFDVIEIVGNIGA